MIFHADSKTTWRSKCGRYRIEHLIAGFGMEVYRCNVEGRESPHHTLTLEKAQEWCRLQEPIPETDFATNCDLQSGGKR